ncbi:MAG: xanthine dehydrogenase small subunit [Woeseiaceae bacterium]|nr:xanthine dehydrogenase small subunit [Woeseiaceae bacterium]
MSANTIRFVLNGEAVEIDVVDPTRTVLQFLREDLRLTGTKEGCAEGDCGACTVVVVQMDSTGDDIEVRTINSCIQFLPTLDGKELITVEGLRGADGRLHPVQQAMVDEHGSQCGFCTPGFVMSLYALYRNNPRPTRRDIDDALAGNLCRCTGYRPIIDAARNMYATEDDWDNAPRLQGLRNVARDGNLAIDANGHAFFAPHDIATFAQLCVEHPDATILAGGTDVGLWVTKQNRDLGTVIFSGEVAEMCEIAVTDTHIEIGAAVTLTHAIPPLLDEYPGLAEMFQRFASPPIRNAGTLGGNIANGSPIGDSMPALMVLGTTLVLRRGDAERTLSLGEFYHDYQVNDLQRGEFLARICVPRASRGVIVSSQKWSKRFDQDISAVCTAYRLRLDGDKVADFRMACGGLAATIRRATNCETALAGKAWNEASIEKACAALAEDFTPIDDMRASADFRLIAVQNLLRRFWLETQGELDTTVYSYGR